METRGVSCYLHTAIRRKGRRSANLATAKSLFLPPKKRLENRATSQEEGEDLDGPTSAEDTVSNIL